MIDTQFMSNFIKEVCFTIIWQKQVVLLSASINQMLQFSWKVATYQRLFYNI